MTPDQFQLLKVKLERDLVPLLPDLIDQNKPADQRKVKNCSRAYSAFAIQKLTGVDGETAGASVIDDFDDNGIDAIHYHQASKKLFIVQSKLKSDKAFKHEDMIVFIQGVGDLLNQKYDRFNQHLLDRQEELDNALDDADEIILVIAHAASVITVRAKNALETFIDTEDSPDERLSKDWIDFGPDDTIRDLLEEKAIVEVDDQVILYGYKKILGQRTTYYGLISIADLARLYNKHGNSLLEKNIRYFLGTRLSSVNEGIHKTLENRPDDFFFFNNGVTALAHSVEYKGRRRDNGRRFVVKGLSVVNGAQTIASSEGFIRQFPQADVSEAKVMFTLIEVDRNDTFGALVTKSRNHQNPVTKAQFAALDPIQERLRRELAHIGIIYKYRPEARIRRKMDNIITISDAAYGLALFFSDPNYPVILKKEPSKLLDNTTEEYRKIFSDNLSGIRLANAVRLYRASEAMLLPNEVSAWGQDKLIYRHGRYAILWLALESNREWLKRSDVMSDKDARNLLTVPMDEWREKVRFAAELDLATSYRGPLAFFRNTTTARPFILAMKREGI